jgi:uncharacterized protein (DUF305 family)
MKRIILVAGAMLALAASTAYAQMQYPRAGEQMPGQQMHAPGMVRGHMMGHGHMMGGRMAQHHMGQGHMQGPGHMMGQGQQGSPSAAHGAHAGAPKGDSGPSSLAFQGINKKMHEGMNIAFTFTGNADADFIRGMIPHHQGAVDMAKTVIAFGKDPQVRKLAEEIIKAQETEIALMQEWLKKNAQ